MSQAAANPPPPPPNPPQPAAPFDFDDFTWPPTNPPRLQFKRITDRDYGARARTKRDENYALYHHKFACNGEKSLPKNEPHKTFLLVSNPETGIRLPGSPRNRQEVLALPDRYSWYPFLNALGKTFAESNNLCRNSCRRIYVDMHNVSRILTGAEKEPSNA